MEDIETEGRNCLSSFLSHLNKDVPSSPNYTCFMISEEKRVPVAVLGVETGKGYIIHRPGQREREIRSLPETLSEWVTGHCDRGDVVHSDKVLCFSENLSNEKRRRCLHSPTVAPRHPRGSCRVLPALSEEHCTPVITPVLLHSLSSSLALLLFAGLLIG